MLDHQVFIHFLSGWFAQALWMLGVIVFLVHVESRMSAAERQRKQKTEEFCSLFEKRRSKP